MHEARSIKKIVYTKFGVEEPHPTSRTIMAPPQLMLMWPEGRKSAATA